MAPKISNMLLIQEKFNFIYIMVLYCSKVITILDCLTWVDWAAGSQGSHADIDISTRSKY